MKAKMLGVIARFVRDDYGQDLLEYALLSATIGLAGAAAWSAMHGAMGESYTSSVNGANSLWNAPDPTPPLAP